MKFQSALEIKQYTHDSYMAVWIWISYVSLRFFDTLLLPPKRYPLETVASQWEQMDVLSECSIMVLWLSLTA
jgi:hypothetical protein